MPGRPRVAFRASHLGRRSSWVGNRRGSHLGFSLLARQQRLDAAVLAVGDPSEPEKQQVIPGLVGGVAQGPAIFPPATGPADTPVPRGSGGMPTGNSIFVRRRWRSWSRTMACCGSWTRARNCPIR